MENEATKLRRPRRRRGDLPLRERCARCRQVFELGELVAYRRLAFCAGCIGEEVLAEQLVDWSAGELRGAHLERFIRRS